MPLLYRTLKKSMVSGLGECITTGLPRSYPSSRAVILASPKILFVPTLASEGILSLVDRISNRYIYKGIGSEKKEFLFVL